MLPYTTAPNGDEGTATTFGLTGLESGSFLWCATTRDRVSMDGDPNASSVRESDRVFMRGLRERITITTKGGLAWHWRRICFCTKGVYFGPINNNIETSRGWSRLLVNSTGSTTLENLASIVFKGTRTVDWLKPFDAKVDTNRIDVKYDKTRVISAGNERGIFKEYKLWHPMNKNFIYSNDEFGEEETLGSTTSNFHACGKQGMGDYWIWDLFEPATAGLSTDVLDFAPQATLYWHEK